MAARSHAGASPGEASVTIVEVAPRDGLQNEREIVATADKVALIARLAQLGATRIEVASFVNPRRVPQMADAEAVIAALPPRSARGYRAIGLCLNLKGVERALATLKLDNGGLDEAGCVLVATDTFGIRNQGQSVEEGIAANRAMLAAARAGGLVAQVTLSAAFGCPFEGEVPPERVVRLAEAMAEAGADEIALADTIGVAVPAQVADLVGRVREAVGAVPLRIHLHDTRGLAPANAWAAYQGGVRVFDSALGGLGGCPFAPRATGNVATEELLYLFERSGVATGLSLEAALATNAWLAGLLGRPLPSRVGRAGDFVTAVGVAA
ncbi:hydroxymethylglutaryl-CoA lyase [Thermaurantiacus sp.]